MSADTYLYVYNSELSYHDIQKSADRVWIGQGGGACVDAYTPASVAFMTRMFGDGPILTERMAVTALDYLNMRNASQYGTRVEHLRDAATVDTNWPGRRGRSSSDVLSRHKEFRRIRVGHGKAGMPRMINYRSPGVAAGRPVKQFFQRNSGKRIISLVD